MIDKLINILIRHKLDDIETIEAAKQIVTMVVESNTESIPTDTKHEVLHDVVKSCDHEWVMTHSGYCRDCVKCGRKE